VISDTVRATNTDFVLPPRQELVVELQAAIKTCGAHFAKADGVTTVTYAG
jgi:hypothetical protein